MLKIGSHVSMSGKKMLLGSVEEMLSYDANCMMMYTGAPQNTRRKDVSELKIEEAKELLKENNLSMDNVIVHAPYIINLANTTKPETFEIAVSFLKEEIKRVEAIGAKYIVLHPGSHVGAGEEVGLNQIIKGLNLVLTQEQDVVVCLETMAGKGKGSELGNTFEQLSYIIKNVNLPEKLGVCMDTCHMHDSGYDLTNFDKILDEFDEIVGIEYLKCMHINDTKNDIGAAKDRHENLGYGFLGFDTIMNIIYNERVRDLVKVLETPYVNDRKIAPYKKEIEMIKTKKFDDWLDEENNIK